MACITEFIITFSVNSDRGMNYCKLYAWSHIRACAQAYELFGHNWSHVYTSKQDAGVDKFRLTEISVVRPMVKILMYAVETLKSSWVTNPIPDSPWIQEQVDDLVEKGYLRYTSLEEDRVLCINELVLTNNGRNLLRQLNGDFS